MNIAFAPIGILVLLIVPALLAGIIVLLIKGGPAVRWFFGILLLLIVIGFFGLFSFRAVPRAVEVDQFIPPQTQLQGGTVHIDKNPTLWAEGLEEELTPDVYSSLETAAYGLGVQLKETMDRLPELPERVTILEDDISDITLLEKFRRGLQYILPDTDILIASNRPSETQTDDQLWITLQHQQKPSGEITIPEINDGNMTHMSQTLNVGNQRGSLQAIVQTANNKFSQQVEYDYRSWLQEPDNFRSQVGRGQWAVITSKEAAVTKEQADEQVRFAAMEYLANQLQIANRVGAAVRDSDLWNYGLVVDEYSQRLVGLSGPIWRSALLLDVSPERIQSLRQTKVAVQHRVRRTWLHQIMSLAGMLLLISILYVLVNAITKGYYSTIIFIVSVIAFLVFVLLFMA